MQNERANWLPIHCLPIQVMIIHLLNGCASLTIPPDQPQQDSKDSTGRGIVVAEAGKLRSTSHGDGGSPLASAGVIGRHLGRSFIRNPIRRPVTTASELVLLTVNGLLDGVKTPFRDLFAYFAFRSRKDTPLRQAPGMDLERWEMDLDRITGSRRTSGELSLLVDGEAFVNRFTAKVASARSSVKIRTYIFDNDEYALQVADLLKSRASDVSVRILMDGLGTVTGSLVDSKSMPVGFVPPASINTYLKTGRAVKTRMLGNTLVAGDHTKSIIIDRSTAFVGGMNIGREYRFDWHDMMVELTGPVVQQIDRDFDRTWLRNGLQGDLALLTGLGRKATVNRDQPHAQQLRLLYTRLHDPQIYRAHLQAIRRARHYIYVENAYFSDDAIRYELIRARRRGVDVRVILPSRGDSGPMDKSNILAANSLFKHGVRVYIYPGMSHIKASIIDGWACFGSANLDRLSLKINKELDIATSSASVVNTLKERIFEQDFARSREMTEKLPSYWSYHVYELVADLVL